MVQKGINMKKLSVVQNAVEEIDLSYLSAF